MPGKGRSFSTNLRIQVKRDSRWRNQGGNGWQGQVRKPMTWPRKGTAMPHPAKALAAAREPYPEQQAPETQQRGVQNTGTQPRVASTLPSPVFPDTMHACTHEVVHDIIAGRYTAEDPSYQGLLLRSRNRLISCVVGSNTLDQSTSPVVLEWGGRARRGLGHPPKSTVSLGASGIRGTTVLV